MDTPEFSKLSLRLFPAKMEAEFWSTSTLLKAYLASVERWLFVSLSFVNIAYCQTVHLAYSRGSLRCWTHAGFVAAVSAQRLFRNVSPQQYWRWRSAITCCSIVAQHALLCVFQVDSVSILSSVAEKLNSRPASLVVGGMLASGAIMHLVAMRLHFPLSFRSTLVFSVSWLVLCSYRNTRELLAVTQHPVMQAGVDNVCATVHVVCGNLLLIPHAIIHRLVARCAARRLWIVLFPQVLGFWWTVWHAYTTEFAFKSHFLALHGIRVAQPLWPERAMMALAVPMIAYISTFILQHGYLLVLGDL